MKTAEPFTTAAPPWVAEIYDSYVTTDNDVAFFRDEALASGGPVLELMAGTGRVSLPLAEAGIPLTCVDLSLPMLERLRSKLTTRGLSAATYHTDVAAMDLPEKDFALAILPFQSFAELLKQEDQRAALEGIARHLRPGGRFICTLHNPGQRRQTIDGRMRLLGTFPRTETGGTVHLWSMQEALSGTPVVRAMQFYEIYDTDGRLEEKRWLEVRFRLVEREEFRSLLEAAGFRVVSIHGDFERGPYSDENSPVMVWTAERLS